MKAITARQPWPLCIERGLKRFETRSWSTSYRGPLLIHAAQRFYDFDEAYAMLTAAGVAPMDALVACSSRRLDVVPRGVVTVKVDLVDVLAVIEPGDEPPETGGFVYADPDFLQVHDDRDDPVPWYLEAERHLGIYRSGDFAWRLANPVPLAEPIPAKGRLGLWDLDLEELDCG